MEKSASLSRLRLRALHICDFRGIDQLDLELVDGLEQPLDAVVLSGDNGCGKTSVLEAILILLGQLRMLPEDTAPWKEQVRFGAREFSIRGTVEFRDRAAVEFRQGRTVPVELSPEMEMLDRPTREMEFPDSGATDVPNGPFWEAIQRLAPEVEYFSARREPESLGESPSPMGARSQREARRVIELKRRLRNAFNRAARQARAGHPVQAGESSIARIQRVWNFLYGDREVLDIIASTNDEGSDDEIVLRDSRLPLPGDITSLAMARQLAPTRPEIPKMVPLNRLSAGQVALFAFAGPLVFRDYPPDIVLIDEPEQHMHVQWQQLLMDLLRILAPQAQFIVATHAEEVLRSVPSHQRFLLVGDDDPRAVERLPNAPSRDVP